MLIEPILWQVGTAKKTCLTIESETNLVFRGVAFHARLKIKKMGCLLFEN